LEYFQQHHPTFRSRCVTIEWERLNQLPQDGSIYNRLSMPEPEQDFGPPQEGENPGEHTPLFTRGFVPNLNTGQTEMDQLRAAAFPLDAPVILTMPIVHGTPISEHDGTQIATDAFPSLFPHGQADFAEPRSIKVTMTEWADHLMRLEDGRFARHPRFRYWALNTIMHHDAKKISQMVLHYTSGRQRLDSG
ncbi:hypothetical protein B0H13DRAFT_1513522, partial [Mycena leptocephala]